MCPLLEFGTELGPRTRVPDTARERIVACCWVRMRKRLGCTVISRDAEVAVWGCSSLRGLGKLTEASKFLSHCFLLQIPTTR